MVENKNEYNGKFVQMVSRVFPLVSIDSVRAKEE